MEPRSGRTRGGNFSRGAEQTTKQLWKCETREQITTRVAMRNRRKYTFFLPSLRGISKCCLSCKIADLKCIPLSVSIYLCSRKRHSPFNFPFAFFLAFSRHFYLQIFDISFSFSTANTQLTFSLAPIILSCQNGMQLPCRGTTESHIS